MSFHSTRLALPVQKGDFANRQTVPQSRLAGIAHHRKSSRAQPVRPVSRTAGLPREFTAKT